ncbi:MAG TPA: TonB-dependent receptor plug domain-containing protein, partial [Bacteroidales bacterium]|nr:TonB-dependent receptor plug domain-containing protein [Bacteroidales bacterium]
MIILFLTFVAFNQLNNAQNLFSILRVQVCDSASSFPLNNARVQIPALKKNLNTDKEGIARFGIPEGQYIIFAEYDGYNLAQRLVSLKGDTSITIRLTPSIMNYDIGEVTVSTHYFNKSEHILPGLDRIDHARVQNLSTIGGEDDLVKTLATLPGVSQGSEGSSDIFVRGGSTDQNLYLLDNNIVYKHSHLLGFLSSANPLIIEEADFYKAAFPARYGGKLSSVIDVKTYDPAMDSLRLKADISTISAKMMADIPLIKNKSGIIVSGRATYIDKLYSLIKNRYGYNNTGFYDLYIKAMHRTDSNNTLGLSLYTDRDYFSDIHKPEGFEEEYSEYRQLWKNSFARISYEHITTDRAFFNTYASISDYRMDFRNENVFMDPAQDYSDNYKSTITDLSAGVSYTKRKDSINTFEAGFEAKYHFLVPSELEYSYSYDDSAYKSSNVDPSNMIELTGHLSRNFILAEKLRLSTGFRLGFFQTTESNFISPEPRLSLQYLTSASSSLKISWARTSQPLHMLTNPGLGLPMDIYLPFSSAYKPATADQSAFAYNTDLVLFGKTFYLTFETYYKKMHNILAYKPGYSSHNLTSHRTRPVSLNDIVTSGTGESFGSEFIIEKPGGKLNGRLSYSLSKTTHFFDELNEGVPFPAKHHRPHNLSLV